MSDSSEDEDLSRFREVVDMSFINLINGSQQGLIPKLGDHENNKVKPKSERYLEESSHYNDVKVPEEMQKRIGAKVSAIIQKKIVFVDVENETKKHKIKGGVKLFTGSEGFLSSEEVKDTYTDAHNINSKKLKKKRKNIDDDNTLTEDDKVKAAAVSGDDILSKNDTKLWKSRRKEKLFKYISQKKNNVLIAME